MTKILKIKKKTFFSIFLSLVLVTCLIVANYLSNLILPVDSTAESISSTEFNLHFLTLSKSQLENEALSHAPDFREIGAGGVVWKQGEYYYVVSSAYANKNDADLVQSSLKQVQNIESEIITVNFKSITLNGTFTADEKKIISKSLSASQNYYNSIYDIAISLDTGVYNEISAKLAVNSAHNTLANIYADFNTLCGEPITSPLKEIASLLKDITKASQSLCTGERISTGQTYSSLLKYRYLEVLAIYNAFLSKF